MRAGSAIGSHPAVPGSRAVLANDAAVTVQFSRSHAFAEERRTPDQAGGSDRLLSDRWSRSLTYLPARNGGNRENPSISTASLARTTWEPDENCKGRVRTDRRGLRCEPIDALLIATPAPRPERRRARRGPGTSGGSAPQRRPLATQHPCNAVTNQVRRVYFAICNRPVHDMAGARCSARHRCSAPLHGPPLGHRATAPENPRQTEAGRDGPTPR